MRYEETDLATGIDLVSEPRIGSRVLCYGYECEVIAVHHPGTVDVAAVDPEVDRAWRVTGLSFRPKGRR